MHRSMGDVLREHQGIAPGSDFVRIALALSVLVWHVPETKGIERVANLPVLWLLNFAAVPMFFGLSGFLVSASAARLNFTDFALNRAARILPALFVQVLLSALLLGPLVTELSQNQYFSSPDFWRYFLNLIGFIHYRLPGVFVENPTSTVNGSLWTIPFEVVCYLVMSILALTRIFDRGRSFIVLAATIVAISTFLQFVVMPTVVNPTVIHYFELTYMHGGQGAVLLPCFLLGAAAHAFRDRFPISGFVFTSCVFALVLMSAILPADVWRITPLAMVFCAMLVYIVCYVCAHRMPRLPIYSNGDYSYGVYLCNFPVLQALVYLLPGSHWAISLAFGMLLATFIAMFSWHVIEKPVLHLRKRIRSTR